MIYFTEGERIMFIMVIAMASSQENKRKIEKLYEKEHKLM